MIFRSLADKTKYDSINLLLSELKG